MAGIPILSESSAAIVGDALGAQSRLLSSRLLEGQIKYIVNKMHRDIVSEVLEGLERSMRSRTKDSWPISFSAILLLSMCIEELEVSAVNSALSSDPTTTNPVLGACRSLEEYPFKTCTKLFHDIYKTHKEASGGSRESGFNPFRECDVGKEHAIWSPDLNQPATKMVRELHQMITTSCKYSFLSKLINSVDWHAFSDGELQEMRSQPSGFEMGLQEVGKNARGRLVSNFLLSFMDENVIRVWWGHKKKGNPGDYGLKI